MATLYVTEFADLGRVGGISQVGVQTPTAEQTVSIGASSAASSAFQNNTKFVRLHTDSICSITFGASPTATSSKARMAANQTEYYAVPNGQSYKVAVITNV